MKNVLIGIVAAIVVAFVAQAAYNNFSVENNQKKSTSVAATAAQPVDNTWAQQDAFVQEASPLAQVAQRQAAPVVVAQAVTPVRPAVNNVSSSSSANTTASATKQVATTQTDTEIEEANEKDSAVKEKIIAEKTKDITQNVTTGNTQNQRVSSVVTAEPGDTVASYEFSFIAPEAVVALTQISAASEQATQNVYVTEEEVLSPSAPR